MGDPAWGSLTGCLGIGRLSVTAGSKEKFTFAEGTGWISSVVDPTRKFGLEVSPGRFSVDTGCDGKSTDGPVFVEVPGGSVVFAVDS